MNKDKRNKNSALVLFKIFVFPIVFLTDTDRPAQKIVHRAQFSEHALEYVRGYKFIFTFNPAPSNRNLLNCAMELSVDALINRMAM